MIEALYIAAPAFIANMAPVIATRCNLFPHLNIPINEHWFGKNKTQRGFLAGVIAACVVTFVQFFIYAPHLTDLFVALVFGVLAGGGALVGDLAKSFLKRGAGVASGQPFIPFDQIDYMLGFLLFTYPYMIWSAQEMIFLIIFSLIANPLVNVAAYSLGIKKTMW